MTKIFLAVPLIAVGLFSGCSKSDEVRARQKAHEAGQEIKEGLKDATREAKEAGRELKQELKEAGEQAKRGVEKAKTEIKRGIPEADRRKR